MGPLTKWLPTLVLIGVALLFAVFVGLQYPA